MRSSVKYSNSRQHTPKPRSRFYRTYAPFTIEFREVTGIEDNFCIIRNIQTVKSDITNESNE